ncbi:transposase [Candidatus Woesearchaeota archaeon]|nr:transposase [Candidatus Woesearchaeota archaeon]
MGENYAIEFLPPYSPQLNCIETCWKTIRYNVTNSNMFDTIPNLKSGIEVFLEKNEFMLNSTDYLIRRLLRFLTTVKK